MGGDFGRQLGNECVELHTGAYAEATGADIYRDRRGLKIHFPGFAKDSMAVAGYLNESRLLLMPSHNEGGPRVVLEAMACGVPVVATPVGIVPDIMPPESIEEWDAKDIADKVRNILGDGMLYSRLQSQGRTIAQNYERSAAIKAYADALKRIAGIDV